MNIFEEYNHKMNRRNFLSGSVLGLGATALSGLRNDNNLFHNELQLTHFAPKGKKKNLFF